MYGQGIKLLFNITILVKNISAIVKHIARLELVQSSNLLENKPGI